MWIWGFFIISLSAHLVFVSRYILQLSIKASKFSSTSRSLHDSSFVDWRCFKTDPNFSRFCLLDFVVKNRTICFKPPTIILSIHTNRNGSNWVRHFCIFWGLSAAFQCTSLYCTSARVERGLFEPSLTNWPLGPISWYKIFDLLRKFFNEFFYRVFFTRS